MADDNIDKDKDQTQDKTDSTQDTKQDDKENKQDDKIDQRTTEALELLDALEDPTNGRTVIENLARQAGLLKAETKQEENKAKKAIKDIIKGHLGEEYKHVSEKLGDAIEEILADKLGEVNNRFESSAKSQAERQFSNDFDSFIKDQEVSDEEAGLIFKQLEVMSPNPKVPLKRFLAEQLELVRFRTGKTSDNKERLKRQADNFNKRGSASGQDAGEKRIQPPKNPSIRDAVLAASRGEKWE